MLLVMKQFKLSFLNRFFFVSLWIFCGCTCTTTRAKDPVFLVDLLVIKKNIDSLIKFDRITIGGQEKRTNGKLAEVLIVEIINPVNEPTDEKEFKKLTKEIAKIAKGALKDPASFNIYKIVFAKRKLGEIYNKDYHGSVFKREEL